MSQTKRGVVCCYDIWLRLTQNEDIYCNKYTDVSLSVFWSNSAFMLTKYLIIKQLNHAENMVSGYLLYYWAFIINNLCHATWN